MKPLAALLLALWLHFPVKPLMTPISSSSFQVVLTDVELPVLLNLAQCVAMNMGLQGEPEAGPQETTGHQGSAVFKVSAAHGPRAHWAHHITSSLPGGVLACS